MRKKMSNRLQRKFIKALHRSNRLIRAKSYSTAAPVCAALVYPEIMQLAGIIKAMDKISPEQFIDNICIENHILKSMCIEVTYRCNERCRHCYVFDEKKVAAEEMNLEQYCKLFDDLRKLETLDITFTGGDVSMRDDFCEILRAARERNFSIGIFTNGTGFSEETLQEIIRIRPQSISFSIYSGNADEHDAMTRVEGSFKKTWTTLKKVKAAGIYVSVKTSVMTPTFGGFELLHAMCEELNIRHDISYYICATNHGNISPTKLRLGEIEKYKQALRIARRGKEIPYRPKRDLQKVICGAGLRGLSVNPYGEVFPCNGFDYRLGNVMETPIEDIWNSDKLKRLYDLRFEQLSEKCCTCLWRDDCLYCLGSSLAENGDILSPVKESCKIAQAMYEFRKEADL